jgi:hypothetical protein
MFARLTIIAVLSVFSIGRLFAQESHTPARVGDLLVVRMTGDVAKEYATRTGMPKLENLDPSGLSISIPVTIAQRRPDGKYRLECSSTVETEKCKPHMLTLTAIIDPKQLKSTTTPKNTPVYASPADAKNGKQPTLTETEEKILHVELSDLHNTKLRTWALVDEVGN